jgi:hypothetical protein
MDTPADETADDFIATEFPEGSEISTEEPTITTTIENSEYLPETGLLDFRGKAILGGSILTVILGLMLAL